MQKLTSFLDKNEKYSKLELPSGKHFLDILEDDQVWLVQCPKSIDITSILEKKIKLPGKATFDDSTEVIGEESISPTNLTLATLKQTDNSERLSLNAVQIQGTIVLRKKIEIENNESQMDGGATKKYRVPFPDNLKERHPLHGISYEEKISINKSIKNRLIEADKWEKKAKRKRDKSPHQVEAANKSISREKSKKKTKHLEKEAQVQNTVIKVEIDDDDNNDDSLNWLKDI